MADPVIEEARNVLQAVSDDPMAREIARLRANAQVTRKLEEAALREEGQREGRAEALRSSIEGLCQALGIALTDAQRATLAASDAEALQQRFNALVRDRAWAS